MYTSARFVVFSRREIPNITTAEAWKDTLLKLENEQSWIMFKLLWSIRRDTKHVHCKPELSSKRGIWLNSNQQRLQRTNFTLTISTFWWSLQFNTWYFSSEITSTYIRYCGWILSSTLSLKHYNECIGNTMVSVSPSQPVSRVGHNIRSGLVIVACWT